MLKKVSFIFLSLLAFGLMAACTPAAAPASSKNDRAMSVNGTGRVTIIPDIAMINIGVRSEAEVVTEALDGNTTQANAIARGLRNMGVEDKDIQTTNFNIYPNDRYNPTTGEVEGRFFVVENTVNVTVRDLSSLGQVLNTVVEAGANSIYGITFSVEDRSAAVAEARDLAIADAKAKAEAIAQSAGVQLGDIINISVYESAMPYPYYDAKGGFAAADAVPIAAGTMTVQMDCNITYTIK